jgi:hypothetical protein
MCRRYKVEMRSPTEIDVFLEHVERYCEERGKAPQLLFTDIE